MILQYTNFKTDYLQITSCKKTTVELPNNNQFNKSTVQQININTYSGRKAGAIFSIRCPIKSLNTF